MPNYVTETRFAVARDEVAKPEARRQWWQLRNERFESDPWERKTWERKASALAIIWKYRDADHTGHYKFTLLKITRRFLAPAMMTRTPNGEQEARVP